MQKHMKVLMPKGTAVWLVENTSLSFKQIAEFCHLSLLEIQAIADGEVFGNIPAFDPIQNNQLTRQEIYRCENEKEAILKFKIAIETITKKSTAKYTPLAKRQNKPGAISWILRHYPDLPDNKVCKLLGTTKSMIESIKNKTHWNMKHIVSLHPVEVGLCSQYDFDMVVANYTMQK